MRSIKRSAAQCLVRRNLARQVSKRLIQMYAVREAMEILAEAKSMQIRHIDECDGGKLKAIRPPDWFFTNFPIADQREQGA